MKQWQLGQLNVPNVCRRKVGAYCALQVQTVFCVQCVNITGNERRMSKIAIPTAILLLYVDLQKKNRCLLLHCTLGNGATLGCSFCGTRKMASESSGQFMCTNLNVHFLQFCDKTGRFTGRRQLCTTIDISRSTLSSAQLHGKVR